jgi:hypothetical protein
MNAAIVSGGYAASAYSYASRNPSQNGKPTPDIFKSLAQRRQLDGKYVQTVIQIAAKFFSRNHLGQISMCCRHQSDVDSMRQAAAQAFELLFLQNA